MNFQTFNFRRFFRLIPYTLYLFLTFNFSLLTLNTFSQTWSDVGGGTNNFVYAFGEYQNKLVVTSGGDTFGLKPINSVAVWDGVKWDSVGSGPTNGVPNSYSIYNNELYAGGNFWYMDSLPNTYHIARWNGSEWLSAGSTNNDQGQIQTMAVFNNNLYVAGNITKIGGVNVNRIAKWNGSNWSNVSGGITGGFCLIYCMAVYNGQLYVGGDFTYAGGKTTYNIARWNGTAWDSVGCAGFDNVVVTMVVDTVANVLYVGGPFTLVGNAFAYQSVKYVAKWNDTTWSSVGNPITNGVSVMEMYHRNLYVGSQSSHGSLSDTIIAYWNGSTWHWVQGLNSTTFALKVYKDTLYVGGAFTLPYNNIARWYSPATGIDDNNSNNESIFIYPNPATTTIYLHASNEIIGEYTVTLYDMHGKPVQKVITSEPETVLDVSQLPQGVYTIRVLGNNMVRSEKVVKLSGP